MVSMNLMQYCQLDCGGEEARLALGLLLGAFNVGRECRGTSDIFGQEVITINLMHSPLLRERAGAHEFRFLQECDVAHPGDPGCQNERERIKA